MPLLALYYGSQSPGLGPDDVLLFAAIAYSVILHEIAHGYAALKFGDRTAQSLGRLTLNPIEHVDPLGTVILPAILAYSGAPVIGWAKPVPVMSHRLEPRVLGDVVVSLAGIVTNLLIATLMAVLLGFRALTPDERPLTGVVEATLWANVSLAMFNLLPIPPLDGSHVMKYLLPASMRASYERIGFYGIFILLLLSAQGVTGKILTWPVVTIVNALYTTIIFPLRGN